MYKQLIEDATPDALGKMLETYKQQLRQEATQPDSVYCHLLTDAGEVLEFKKFVYAGFLNFVEEFKKDNSIEKTQILLARHLSLGLTFGFRYAMYLHERRELEQLFNTSDSSHEAAQ